MSGDGDGAAANGDGVASPRVLDAERRQQMVAFVEERNGATVAQLSGRFGISEATARRDLTQLSRRGLLVRAHGGAIPRRLRTAEGFPEPPIMERASTMPEEKRRIGAAAAALVEDGDTILIAGGSTAAAMIPHLAERSRLTVMTNNLNVASLLVAHPRIALILLGGILRHSELSLLGILPEEALKNLRADKLFIGSSAIHVDYGLSADDMAEVQTDRALVASAREITVVADRTKFGRVRTARVVPMGEVYRVVTDRDLADEQVRALREQGILVELA